MLINLSLGCGFNGTCAESENILDEGDVVYKFS